MSCTELADGELAAVVTFLEMLEPPVEPVPPSPLSLRHIVNPQPDEYRTLFRLVGERWLWFSRLIMTDDRLAAILGDPDVDLYAIVDEAGRDCGMVELDFRQSGECELAFVGLLPRLAGKGHGRWLLSETLRLAWRDGVRRAHVHTCTLDHPAALAAYLRAGFVPVRRAVERFGDPRLLEILPADCAPQVPLCGTVAAAPAAPPASCT